MAGFNGRDDFVEVVDGLTTAAVARGDGSAPVQVSHALRRAVTTREAERSAGQYTASDVVWYLPAAELPQAPALGDAVIEADGRRWTVLEVRELVQASQWRCVTRNLAIVHGLDQLIDIEKATYAKSSCGASVPTWEPWRTGLYARIQSQSSLVEERDGRLGSRARYRVFLAENVAVDHTCRIKGPDGTRYRIIAVRQAARIDALTRIHVVRIEQGVLT